MAQKALNLVVIGPKHSGKTVYFAALSHCPQVDLNDPDTLEIISMHWNVMEKGGIPEATASIVSNMDFNYVCTLDGKDYNLDFSAPDYDGLLAESLSKAEKIPNKGNAANAGSRTSESGEENFGNETLVNSEDILKLQEHIKQADGFIILMPYGEEDDAAMVNMLRHEMHIFISLVREIFTQYAKIPAPLIIAVNKWDKSSPNFKKSNEDSEALKYIRSVPLYNLIYERLQNYFANIVVLAVSAYGHHTDSPRPIPGKMAPWRVTEPITRIVQAYFANLDESINEQQADPAKLADTLLRTRPIWQRVPDKGYAGLLQETLDRCYGGLVQQLEKATNLHQFRHILATAPEAAFRSDFTPAQQVELEKLEAPHMEVEKKRRNKMAAIAVVALLLVGTVAYLINLNSNIQKDWHAVSTAESQDKPALLADFVGKYGAAPVAKMLAATELKEARNQLEETVGNLQQTLDRRLDAFEKYTDSCKVAEEAKQLTATSRSFARSLAPGTMHRLETVLESSREICEARAAIESAEDDLAVQQALTLLANKPDSEEVRQLKEAGAARKHYLSERDRIDPILAEFTQLADQNLDRVKFLIREHGNDESDVVLEKVAQAKRILPEIFYNEIMRKIGEVHSLDGSSMQELKELVRDNIQDITLTVHQVGNIRAAMQAMAEKADRAALSPILVENIQSQTDLDSKETDLKKLNNASHLSLDGGLFEYSRPDDLQRELGRKLATINRYKNAINGSVDASWVITANASNAIDLDCGKFGPDARLEIFFGSPGMPDQRHTGGELRCIREDGGRYKFYFHGPVSQYHGSITLKKNSRIWGMDKICRSILNLTANDLIRLVNGNAVEFSLESNCQGISIKFTRSGS